jgi:hypothetical protein
MNGDLQYDMARQLAAQLTRPIQPADGLYCHDLRISLTRFDIRDDGLLARMHHDLVGDFMTDAVRVVPSREFDARQTLLDQIRSGPPTIPTSPAISSKPR